MNGKELLKKMEYIDTAYIDAADKIPIKKKKPIMWPQFTALAACLAIAVVSALMLALSPDKSLQVMSKPETASLFSGGGVTLILLIASLVAAAAIVALIIKDKKK